MPHRHDNSIPMTQPFSTSRRSAVRPSQPPRGPPISATRAPAIRPTRGSTKGLAPTATKRSSRPGRPLSVAPARGKRASAGAAGGDFVYDRFSGKNNRLWQIFMKHHIMYLDWTRISVLIESMLMAIVLKSKNAPSRKSLRGMIRIAACVWMVSDFYVWDWLKRARAPGGNNVWGPALLLSALTMTLASARGVVSRSRYLELGIGT